MLILNLNLSLSLSLSLVLFIVEPFKLYDTLKNLNVVVVIMRNSR